MLAFLASLIPKLIGAAKTAGTVASAAKGVSSLFGGGGSGNPTGAPGQAGGGVEQMAPRQPLVMESPTKSVSGNNYGSIIADMLRKQRGF